MTNGNDTKKPEPLFLDPAFLSPMPVSEAEPSSVESAPPEPPVEVQAHEKPVVETDHNSVLPAMTSTVPQPVDTPVARKKKPSGPAPSAGLEPLPLGVIPEKLHKHVDSNSPPPVRLMGARAMIPMPPKDTVHVVYQAIFDPDPRIAKMAAETFRKLDNKILDRALAEELAAPALGLIVDGHRENVEIMKSVLLNPGISDDTVAQIASSTNQHELISLICGNQERLLRAPDIVRELASNENALRSDLDRAIDFLVRQGIYLDGVSEFEDAFVRLGKKDMLDAVSKIEVNESDLTEDDLMHAAELGVGAEEYLLGTSDVLADVDDLLSDQEAEAADKRTATASLASYPLPTQVKLALTGKRNHAVEGVHSTNRMVASAAIRNPRLTDSDVMKIVRSKSLYEDVVRYICGNGDWTKSYTIKYALVQNPKTPVTLVMRWMPLLRKTDLRTLSKSKQIPSAVQAQAKKMLRARG
jgi:hypothetical protein